MKVAIVGTGISGVTLALRLQQLGVETTVLSERAPDQLRHSRIENLVARFPATRERERLLGVAHWSKVEGSFSVGIDLDVVGTPLGFHGRVGALAQAVDFRVYLSRLLEDYAARGGEVRIGPLPEDEAQLHGATEGHDVVVVAAGRGSPIAGALFPVRVGRSPYEAPQRRLLGGLCTGLAPTEPPVVNFTIVPGAGEIFSQPMLTASGLVTSFLIEAIPDSVLEPITQQDTSDLEALESGLRAVFEQHAPALAERGGSSGLALLGPSDLVRGAITPTVRRLSARLRDGRLALAIGDAWILNDPVLGQGANIGSHCAWAVAHAIAAEPTFDDAFAARLEDELWSFAGPITALTNAFLQPPPPHVLELLGAATAHQPIADAFTAGFADPVRLAHTLLSPRATEELVRSAQTIAA